MILNVKQRVRLKTIIAKVHVVLAIGIAGVATELYSMEQEHRLVPWDQVRSSNECFLLKQAIIDSDSVQFAQQMQELFGSTVKSPVITQVKTYLNLAHSVGEGKLEAKRLLQERPAIIGEYAQQARAIAATYNAARDDEWTVAEQRAHIRLGAILAGNAILLGSVKLSGIGAVIPYVEPIAYLIAATSTGYGMWRIKQYYEKGRTSKEIADLLTNIEKTLNTYETRTLRQRH